jgi:hypothetical protein
VLRYACPVVTKLGGARGVALLRLSELGEVGEVELMGGGRLGGSVAALRSDAARPGVAHASVRTPRVQTGWPPLFPIETLNRMLKQV